MTGGEDGGSPRVSIPDSLRGTIQGIKEIAVNHSDEDIYGMLKECNMDSEETTQKLLYLDTFQLVKSKRKVQRVTRVDDYSDNQYFASDNYNGGQKSNSNLERRSFKSTTPIPRKGSNKSTDVASSTAQQAKLNGNKDDKDVRSRRASSSTSTNPSKAGSNARIVGGSSKLKQSKHRNDVGSSSASDPVNNTKSLPVGTIKRETTKNQNVSQTPVSGSVDLTSSNTQSQVNGSLKEMSEDPSSKNSTSELFVKPKQSVIFPAHFHVPENFKSALSFGSFESNNQGSSDPVDCEASPTPQTSSQISGHDDYPDQTSHAPLNLTSSEENILSGADLRYDQSEQEILQSVGQSNDSLLQSVGQSNDSLLDYGSSLAPPAVQHQGLETQEENTGMIPSSSQPTTCTTPSDPTQSKLGSWQNSVPASPHVYHFLPTYPLPNYMPVSPYYLGPHYMPQQNVHHQLPSHNGYPHQPSASDNYIPPTAASASGPKIPSYKQGSITNFGTPAVYGSSPFPDDMSRSELKEKNMHSNLPPRRQVGLNSFSGLSMPTQSIHRSQPPTVFPPSLSSYPQPQLLSLPQQQYNQQFS